MDFQFEPFASLSGLLKRGFSSFPVGSPSMRYLVWPGEKKSAGWTMLEAQFVTMGPTHSERPEIVIDSLPVTSRRSIRLVHDPDIQVFGRAPPVPSFAVGISARKSMEMVHVPPVREPDHGVTTFVVCGQ